MISTCVHQHTAERIAQGALAGRAAMDSPSRLMGKSLEKALLEKSTAQPGAQLAALLRCLHIVIADTLKDFVVFDM